MSDYRALMRKKLLEEMYDKLSTDEKRLFIRMTLDNKSHDEIMSALKEQERKLDTIHKGQSFWLDFGSNVAGNAVWDGIIWLGAKLFRKL